MEVTSSIVTYKTPEAELVNLLACFARSQRKAELIVVDNSPTDELKVIVEGSGAKYVWSGRNLGFGAGHNIAIRAIAGRSKYHVLVNPDISFAPDTLEVLFGFMESNPAVGLVMPKIIFPDGSEQRLCKQLPSPFDLVLRRFLGGWGERAFRSHWQRYELRDIDLSIPRQIPCLSGCFMFLRSSVLYKVGGFDERYFMYLEDFDLCRRVGECAKTVFYPDTSVTHAYAKSSYKDPTHLRYHLHSAFKYFSKWGWLLDSGRREMNELARSQESCCL